MSQEYTATFSLRYTIWSNGGRHEWVIYNGEELLNRSGLIFKSRSAAMSALKKFAKTLETA